MIGMILGPDGIVVIVVVALVLVFGGSKIPKLARGIGSASREFKLGAHTESDETSTDSHSSSASAETGPMPAVALQELDQS